MYYGHWTRASEWYEKGVGKDEGGGSVRKIPREGNISYLSEAEWEMDFFRPSCPFAQVYVDTYSK